MTFNLLVYYCDAQEDLMHDFAVITLTKDLTYDEYVQPIRLADTGVEAQGKSVTSGWGNTRHVNNNGL